jgi:hypothetical protein
MIGFATQEEWYMQYPILVLDRAELQNYLSAGEVDRLNDQDLSDIAAAMMQELAELGVYEQMAFIARCKLAQKQGGMDAENFLPRIPVRE